MDEMSKLRQGMDVVDLSGDKVGEVRSFKMGDPEAVTTQGQEMETHTGLFDILRRAFGDGTDIPEQEHERLLRLGYVEIDASGLFKKDFVVSAEQVDKVDDDTVYLSVTAP